MTEKAAVRYRLGIDLSSNSLRWAVLRLNAEDNPNYLMRIGTRIISDVRKLRDAIYNLKEERRSPRVIDVLKNFSSDSPTKYTTEKK